MQFIIELPHSEVLVQVHPSATAAEQARFVQYPMDPLHACPVGHVVHVEQAPPEAAVALPACLHIPPQQIPISQSADVTQAKELQ